MEIKNLVFRTFRDSLLIASQSDMLHNSKFIQSRNSADVIAVMSKWI